jgi:hypothetical protein
MKAEWCLWEAYSKWDLGLNPFLGHFVQVWESGGQTPDVLIVGVILSGQAHEVASWGREGLRVVDTYDGGEGDGVCTQ